MVSAGITEFVKLEAMPIDRNQILLRLTNLQDFMASSGNDKNVTVDLDQVFKAFYQSANNMTESEPLPEDMELQISERSLTNNMEISEM